MTNRINREETDQSIYFQINRVKSKRNTDTFEENTLLQQNGGNNDNSKKFGSGYLFTKDRIRDDTDVKWRKKNRGSTKPRFLSVQ